MTDDQLDAAMWSRLQGLLEHAVNGLDPADRQERAEWCRENNTHGVRAHFNDPTTIRLEWGGRLLAVIDREVLTGDSPFRTDFIPKAPDTVPPKW